jgi:hypothetical protein
MKQDAFIEKLDQIGAEWIISADDPDDMRGRKRKGVLVAEPVINETGYPHIKKWPRNKEWCNQCNQLVEGKTTQIKITDQGHIIKCYCGKKYTQDTQKT